MKRIENGSAKSQERWIIHVDMDAFFASVEQRDRPELRGKPVIVGGRPESRGVVAAASYEARAFGIRSAMPSAQATRLCPDAIFVPHRMERYVEVSRRLRKIFGRHTPVLEPVALDECFLDVTGRIPDGRSPAEVAVQIKRSIRDELGLTSSAGVAPSKFVAKVASDFQKPDGLVVVRPEQVEAFLEPLPVRIIWGIGPKTGRRLSELGITIVADLKRKSVQELVTRFGKNGYRLSELARGHDPSPVRTNRPLKQISREQTYSRDLVTQNQAQAALLKLLADLAERLQRRSRLFRGIHIKVRYSDFTTVTRSVTLPAPIEAGPELKTQVLELFRRTEAGSRPVRLLGIAVSELERENLQLVLPFPETGEG